MLTNFFRSAGYGVEKLHSGMIAYMSESWNEGRRTPLASFLRHLGVPLKGHAKLRAVREWRGIDLVVFDAEDGSEVVAFEMKVDSHEGSVRGEPQTVAYRKLLSDETPFLYVTLGAGEFHRAPRDERARWVRDFEGALKAVSTVDPFVMGWREAICEEVDLQDACASDNPPPRTEGYRGSTRNLYLLGYLKESLEDHLAVQDLGLYPFVHAVSPRPDTILHFGRSRSPAYLEINRNGLLNLKVDLDDLSTEAEKNGRLGKVKSYYEDLLGRFEPEHRTQRATQGAKTRTIMSFDVGLDSVNGHLFYGSTKAETVRRSAEVLEAFYGMPGVCCAG